MNHETSFNGHVDFDFHHLKIVASAEVNATLNIKTNVNIKVGQSIFHNCLQIAEKTVGIDVVSTGDVVFGIEIESNDAKIEKLDGKWYLVFKINYNVYGSLKTWRFDDIKANNCKIRIFGIQIANVCEYIEKKVRE